MNKPGQFLAICTLLSAFLCGSSQAQDSQSLDEKADGDKTGSISGRVVNESGQGLAGVRIFVRAFGSTGQGRSTGTDAQGNFKIDGLDPAAYLISPVLPAYTTAVRDPDSTQPTYYRIGDSVRLELIKGGVITGTVTSSNGEPVVAIPVRAYMIRDDRNRPPRYSTPFRDVSTDDRGIYRIYGLTPGTYVVSAGGGESYTGYANAYQDDVRIFAPSSTRDTANEISVRAGEETSNVDIRYRVEPGHIISGTAIGSPAPPQSPLMVILNAVVNGETQTVNSVYQPFTGRGFSFAGVADGEYDLTAQSFVQGGEWLISEHRHIKVKGADVTGIELLVKPLSSVSGHVALEESTAAECKGKRRPVFAETVITPWHNEKNVTKDQPQFSWSLGGPTVPDKQGDFTLRNLAPGQYRFHIRPFAKYWYLRSITLAASTSGTKPAQPGKPVDAARNWTTLKTGDRIPGLLITLAEGAASLHGQIKLLEGQKSIPRTFVYLVPAERERSEDILRFFAYQISSDGTFALNNLPPGRYWLLARPAPDTESNIFSRLRLPDEAEMRARVRADAEAAKTEVILKPCQNITGYELLLNGQ